MEKEQINLVPVGEKYLLSIREASEYFGIGEKRIRFLISNNPSLGICNGAKKMVHRKKFEKFIDETSSI